MKNYIKDKVIEINAEGWHSIKNYYTNSDNDWVLILRIGPDGMFLLPKIAEYRFSQAAWYDQDGNKIDESIDKIIAWQKLPNPIKNIDKRIINQSDFIKRLNDYIF